MQFKYKNAGSDWKDSKYQQLGDIINECCLSFDVATRELNYCLTSLNDLARNVLDYKEINILGNTLPVIERADSFGRHIPVNNGSWNGEHGNSFWYPNSDVILKDMRYYGIRK